MQQAESGVRVFFKTLPTFNNIINELLAAMRGEGIVARTYATPHTRGAPTVHLVLSRAAKAAGALLPASPLPHTAPDCVATLDSQQASMAKSPTAGE